MKIEIGQNFNSFSNTKPSAYSTEILIESRRRNFSDGIGILQEFLQQFRSEKRPALPIMSLVGLKLFCGIYPTKQKLFLQLIFAITNPISTEPSTFFFLLSIGPQEGLKIQGASSNARQGNLKEIFCFYITAKIRGGRGSSLLPPPRSPFRRPLSTVGRKLLYEEHDH